MGEKRLRIKVDSFLDLAKLLDEYDNPNNLFLPLIAYNRIFDQSFPHFKGRDGQGEYILCRLTRVRPPKMKYTVVDLSDAEVIDSE